MTLDEVMKMWKEDAVINYKDIPLMDRDTVNGGPLQEKYRSILAVHRIQAGKLQLAATTLKYRLEQFYTNSLYCDELGTTDKETGKVTARKPAPKLAKTKAEAEAMIATDPKWVNLVNRIAENDEIILYTKDVVDYIRYNRTKDITNHIEWLKWHNGNTM